MLLSEDVSILGMTPGGRKYVVDCRFFRKLLIKLMWRSWKFMYSIRYSTFVFIGLKIHLSLAVVEARQISQI